MFAVRRGKMKKRKIGVNGIAMWGIERKIDMKNRKKERGENVEKERRDGGQFLTRTKVFS